MSSGAVFVSSDLISRIVTGEAASGWFFGTKMKSESTYLVFGTSETEEPVWSTAFSRLIAHEVIHVHYGAYEEKLVEWFKVTPGFNDRFDTTLELEKK
jgi:hypothetical protein